MVTQLKLRLICYSNELIGGLPIYVSSNAFPVKALNREPARHSFHSAALLLRGFGKEEKEVKVDDQNVSSDKSESYFASSESYSSKGKKKSGSEEDQQDHYAFLGLGHLETGWQSCVIGPVYPTFWLSRFFADVWMMFPKEEEYIEWFTEAGFKDVQLKRI